MDLTSFNKVDTLTLSVKAAGRYTHTRITRVNLGNFTEIGSPITPPVRTGLYPTLLHFCCGRLEVSMSSHLLTLVFTSINLSFKQVSFLYYSSAVYQDSVYFGSVRH